MDLTDKLLTANQYGILITSKDGHYYLYYETDLELSPTEESKYFLRALSCKGIDLQYKQYGKLEDVLDRLDDLYKFIGLETEKNTIIQG